MIWKELFGVSSLVWGILKEGTIVFACSKEKYPLLSMLS